MPPEERTKFENQKKRKLRTSHTLKEDQQDDDDDEDDNNNNESKPVFLLRFSLSVVVDASSSFSF